MEAKLTLWLPRDAQYVPVVRGIAQSLLADIEVPSGAAEDITLALTEACANAVRHAEGVEEYSVSLAVDDAGCEVEVVDLGPGFDLALREAHCGDESGRGIRIMRALVDALHFEHEGRGVRVRLVKRWDAQELGKDHEVPAPPASTGRHRDPAPTVERVGEARRSLSSTGT